MNNNIYFRTKRKSVKLRAITIGGGQRRRFGQVTGDIIIMQYQNAYVVGFFQHQFVFILNC